MNLNSYDVATPSTPTRFLRSQCRAHDHTLDAVPEPCVVVRWGKQRKDVAHWPLRHIGPGMPKRLRAQTSARPRICEPLRGEWEQQWLVVFVHANEEQAIAKSLEAQQHLRLGLRPRCRRNVGLPDFAVHLQLKGWKYVPHLFAMQLHAAQHAHLESLDVNQSVGDALNSQPCHFVGPAH